MNSAATEKTDIYHVIGIGFGPAGIALAVAMEDADEEGKQPPMRSLFLEQSAEPGWQSNMLLFGTDIQHHFLRDYATPRNPRSRFTFPCYLKEKGRLFSFSLQGGYVGRIEWADYTRWVAEQLTHRALYHHKVVAVEPVENKDGAIDLVRVRARDTVENIEKEFYARNLVVCSGRTPNIPPLYAPFVGPRLFHSHYFKASMQRLQPPANTSFAVIGSGQNAIEIILYLADQFPKGSIYSINRNSGFRLYDLGHFSNQIYFPEDAEYFFSLPKEARRKLFEEVRLTNYSSVDADVSRALYLRMYEEGICGIEHIQVIKRVIVTEVTPLEDSFELLTEDIYRHCTRPIRADVVILSTGFIEDQTPPMLKAIQPYLKTDEDGDLIVLRDYQIPSADRFQVGVYINGLTERTHGISDSTSFSMMALKAQRTLESLDARREELGY